jgi:molybdate transport system substrate-binding protein
MLQGADTIERFSLNHTKLTSAVTAKRRLPGSTRRLLLCVGACVAVAIAGCRATPEPPPRRGKVRVAAAADLNAAFSDLIVRFGSAHDVDVSVSFGSSGNFYAQLLNQAPFDLFLSADVAYPNQLAARGLVLPQSEFTYAIGHIVVWAPSSSTLDVEREGLQALTAASVAHVAVANPEYAPYGRAAVAAMQSAGVYDRVRPKLVVGENIAQTMQFVQSGAADVGIVALSLTRAPTVKGKGRLFEIPASTYPRLEQGGAILKWAADVDAARAFRGFLLSADGRAILERYGFARPDR